MEVVNALSFAGLPAPACMPYPRGSPRQQGVSWTATNCRPTQFAAISPPVPLIVAMETSCRPPCSLATGATFRHQATPARLVLLPPGTLHHSGIDRPARKGRHQASKAAAGAAESGMAPAPPPVAAAAQGQQRQVLPLQAVDITAENFKPFGQARRARTLVCSCCGWALAASNATRGLVPTCAHGLTPLRAHCTRSTPRCSWWEPMTTAKSLMSRMHSWI
jgi:hypothetical protein